MRGPSVPPDGSPTSNLWLIGEAPGATEERLGRVFIGPAGQHLDMGLRDAGLLRTELFVWNIFQKRPPNNDVGYFFQDNKNRVLTAEAQEMVDGLQLLIEEHRPNCVVALGATALWVLCGKKRITKWRGSVLPCELAEGTKVYPTYHPSYVMRLMQEKKQDDTRVVNVYPTFVKDLKRAAVQAEQPSFPSLRRRYILPTSVDHVESYLGYLKQMRDPIACDIETVGIGGEIPVVSRIGFAYSWDEGISIPLVQRGALCWTLPDFGRVLKAVSELFLEGPKMIFQNGFFDLVILGKLFGLRVKDSPFDTMIQQHCAYPHMPRSLEFQASVYTWQPYYKDERKRYKMGQISDEALSKYNIDDCCVTKEIQSHTYGDIVEMGMRKGFDRTTSLYPSLLFMMCQGVKVDLEVRDELRKQFKEKIDDAKERLTKYGGDINHRSPKQLADLLYVRMGFPMQTKRGSKKVTTDKDALATLKRKTQHPVFDAIFDLRKYERFMSNYLNMEVSPRGRVYTSYDPAKTVTWRLSSSESSLGYGTNLQTIPKRDDDGRLLRKMFVADEGMEMVASDLEQAEDRVVVWKAGDEFAIEDYLEGRDPHWEHAKRLFGLDPELEYDAENPDHWTYRNRLAKHAKHAGNYGMHYNKLYEMFLEQGFYEYALKDVRKLMEDQRRATPYIEAWKQWVRDQVSMNRKMVTALGRVRYFYGRISDELFRAAYAFEPQSVVGELLNMAIRDVHDELHREGLRVLMNVHDEMIVQVPEGTAGQFIPYIREVMERTFEIEDVYGTKREISIPADFKVGPNWYDLKKWKEEG